MKLIGRILGYLLFTVFLIVGVYAFLNWHDDLPVEGLKKKYTYPDSKFMDLQGMDVHYRITGQGDPLLLIHGTASSLHTWEEWTKELAGEFQVISVDIPAFGLTGPHPERKYDMVAYTDFISGFMGQLGIDQFSMAGNSLGGRICWAYALRFPEQVKKMILIDASGYPSDKPLPLALKLGRNKVLGPVLTKLTPKALHKKSLKEVYGNDELITEELLDRYFELMLRPGNRQAFVDRTRQKYVDQSASIKSIKTPTLIMWGDGDLWVEPKFAQSFHQDIEGSELIIYKGAGHVPMEEIPLQTARDAKTFLLQNDEANLVENALNEEMQ